MILRTSSPVRLKEIADFFRHPFRSISRLREARMIYRSDLFDKQYYLTVTQLSFLKGFSAARHYADIGWKEGRDPGPRFSTRYYLRHNDDVAASGINPLLH